MKQLHSKLRASMVLMAAVMVTLTSVAAHAITYATITDVTCSKLSNCVQIMVKSDGMLDWDYDYGNYGQKSSRISLRFAGARSSVANFIDVSAYPVSYVQTSVPQNAKDGIGISMTIGLFTTASYNVSSSSDGCSVIITVNSDRTIEGGGNAGGSSTEKQKTEFTCTCEKGLMSIQALKANIIEVLAEIARVSGLNIVVDDAIDKRLVSMSMENVSPEDLLKAIASGYGLALSNKDGVYSVTAGVPTDLATYRSSGTQSFPMRYVQAQTASGLLPTFLYSYLHVNGEQNAVVVSAPTQMLDKIKKDLSKVDIAPPQIMVDVLAIELSTGTDFTTSLGLTGNSEHGQASSNSNTGEISFTTVGLLPRDFNAKLEALIANNKARINSNPRMAVLNGHDAEIFIGAQRFIRVQYSSWGQTLEKIQGVDVGTRIWLSAWTGGNGEITIKVNPEVSNVVDLERQTGLPTLSSRRASTTIRARDGETIIIGGLTTRQDYDTQKKVPVLGDLPLIGNAFKSRSKTTGSTELVILITPRVLSDSCRLSDADEAAARKTLDESLKLTQ